jgi:periplasmic protein TonB
MFDAISVSQRSRKPWTVAVSLAGQAVMVGLAILLPLVTTEALPHAGLLSTLLPEPPAPPPARRAPAAMKAVRPQVRVANLNALMAPVLVPSHVAIIEEPAPTVAPSGMDGGVPGGTGNPLQRGNTVIGGMGLASAPPTPPPPAPNPPAPEPVKRIRVGGILQSGKLISAPQPVYPALARTARISGVVRLQAVIARDATTMDLRLVNGHPMLVAAAMAAVKQWVFKPTLLNGEPVEVATEITVNFTLQ